MHNIIAILSYYFLKDAIVIKSKKNLPQLPNELLIKIFEFLRCADLYSCSKTCKRIQHLAINKTYLKFYLDFISIFMNNKFSICKNEKNEIVGNFYHIEFKESFSVVIVTKKIIQKICLKTHKCVLPIILAKKNEILITEWLKMETSFPIDYWKALTYKNSLKGYPYKISISITVVGAKILKNSRVKKEWRPVIEDIMHVLHKHHK